MLGPTFAADTTKLINVNDAGIQSNQGVSAGANITADGKEIVFRSIADNLVLGESHGIFVRNLETKETSVLFPGTKGTSPIINASGQYVVFSTQEPLAAPDSGSNDRTIYRYDRWNQVAEVVNQSSDGTTTGNSTCCIGTSKISPNGRFILFDTWATNLVDGVDLGSANLPLADHQQLYLRDMLNGTTTLVSMNSAEEPGNALTRMAYGADVNDNGDVVFVTASTNMVAGNTDGSWDVFLRKQTAPLTTNPLVWDAPILVNINRLGVKGNHHSSVILLGSLNPLLTSDGKVLFLTYADNLILDENDLPDDANGHAGDLILRDIDANTNVRTNLDNSGNQGGVLGGAHSAAISPDGNTILFIASNQSFFDNPLPSSINGWNVFRRNMLTGITDIVSLRSDGTRSTATFEQTNGSTYLYFINYISMSSDGNKVVFSSRAPDLIVSGGVIQNDANHNYTDQNHVGIYDHFVRTKLEDPMEAADDLVEDIETLIDTGATELNNGGSNKLLSDLADINKQVSLGHTTSALGMLDDFITDVGKFMRKGDLTQAQGDALIDSANVIIELLAP